MCGIVGVINQKNAPYFILNALKTLEYRGYDSAGIYIREDQIFKTVSRVKSLEKDIKNVKGLDGLGHTRWATHGKSTLENAHPHQSYHKIITLVHNGIIKNYSTIKEFLLKKEYQFYGETDTEVLTNYIEYLYLTTKNMETTMFNLLDDIQGELAIAFFVKDDPSLYYLKKESPLVIAKNNNIVAISSDVMPLNKFKEFYFPEDNEFGYLNQDEQYVYRNYKKEKIEFKKEDYSSYSSSLGHYKHYMLKEIFEEPKVIDRIATYVQKNDFKEIKNLLKSSKKIRILGCGTSFNAGYYIEKSLKDERIKTIIASEFDQVEKATYILISQSGETYDLISAAKKLNGNPIILLTNNLHSTLARMIKNIIFLNAGSEIAVAATKSYISSIILLNYLFKDIMVPEIFFQEAKETIEKTLVLRSQIKEQARKICLLDSLYCIGKNVGEAVLKEASLKIKEISYIHAESIYSGELKHGPISTLDGNFGSIFLISEEKMYANVKEVEARNAPCFVLEEGKNLPRSPKDVSYLSAMVYFELLSYEIANILKRDIDKPRNLAKSVTVI